MSQCPICNSRRVERFMELNAIPTTQNMVYGTRETSRQAACKNIHLVFCGDCGFVFNQSFSQEDVSYTQEYNNDQSASGVFSEYVNDQIAWLKNKYIHADDDIAEIGCGKGYYIKRLAGAMDSAGKKYGFDTTYDGDSAMDEGVCFYKSYFTEQYSHLSIDFAICRHTIEHIPRPVEFLKSIRKSLKANTKIFLETPDFNWITQHNAFFDINYEHCSYYSMDSLTLALELAGFEVVEAIHGFGGQYMWFVAQPSHNANTQGIRDRYFPDRYMEFSACVESEKKKCAEAFRRIKEKNGVTAIWGGAGAKGSMLLNLIDKDNDLIDYVVDINPQKQYKYMGGTGHQVIPPKDVGSKNITDIFVLNPNYYHEVCSLCHGMADAAQISIHQLA